MHKGARLLYGGYIPSMAKELNSSDVHLQGSFYPPTILVDVPDNALIAQEGLLCIMLHVHN